MQQVSYKTRANSLCAQRGALCVNGSCSCAIRSTISGKTALTLVEMVMALAIMAIVFAAILPQFRAISNSWDSKQAGAEALQNGRVLIEHLNRNLIKAVRITDVSDSTETDGFIAFEDNDGNTLRYDVNGTTSYVEFGVVGALSNLAGPVSQLQFTCYDACDFDTAITDCNYIRFVNVQTTLTNSATMGQDKTFTASAYLRTNWSTSGGGSQVTYQEFTEANLPDNDTSVTISTPGSTSEGDLLIAAVVTDGDTKASLSPPGGEGWTLIDLDYYYGQATLGVWWKLADASESPSHQFSWDDYQEAYGWIMRFTSHHPTAPINASAAQGGSSSLPECPSVTTTVASTMIVRIGGFDDDDIIVDTPGLSGHTVITMDRSNTGNQGTCSGGAGYLQQAAIGASGTSSFSLTAAEGYRTVTIAIAPEPVRP